VDPYDAGGACWSFLPTGLCDACHDLLSLLLMTVSCGLSSGGVRGEAFAPSVLAGGAGGAHRPQLQGDISGHTGQAASSSSSSPPSSSLAPILTCLVPAISCFTAGCRRRRAARAPSWTADHPSCCHHGIINIIIIIIIIIILLLLTGLVPSSVAPLPCVLGGGRREHLRGRMARRRAPQEGAPAALRGPHTHAHSLPREGQDGAKGGRTMYDHKEHRSECAVS
jgi:hypothetical protein